MEIRHAVRENRLSDPNLVTSADCAAFIEPSDIWVWIEDDPVRAFAAGDTRNGWIWALFVDPGHEGRGIGLALLPLACETLRNGGYTSATLTKARARIGSIGRTAGRRSGETKPI